MTRLGPEALRRFRRKAQIVFQDPYGSLNPKHPYTEALLSAVPNPDPSGRKRRIVLEGDVPNAIAPPSGCVFRTRCRYAVEECAHAVPPLRHVSAGHQSACIRDDIL